MAVVITIAPEQLRSIPAVLCFAARRSAFNRDTNIFYSGAACAAP